MNLNIAELEKFKTDLPTRKEEAWKYTSLTSFKEVTWSYLPPTLETSGLTHDQMQQISLHLPVEFCNLVFINGQFNATLSDELSSQIEISEIESADFTVDKNHAEKKLIDYSQACLQKKIKIKLLAHQVFEKPIHIVFAQNSISPQYISERVDVHVGKGAEVTLLTQTLSLDEISQGAINLRLNISADESAKVKLIQIQNENINSFHFAQTEIQVSSKVQLLSLVMTLGGKLCRNYFHLQLLGAHADVGVYGLNAIGNAQHSDHYTFIQHSTGGNESRQHYKSVLSDAAHSVFRGRVRIEKDAQKANSEQLNNNLLLTREAQADSIPQLEIYADDVKAGHGSTVGQLNKDEIFYFLSRGINQYQAVKMLSFGFAQELIYKFQNPVVQDWLLKKLNKKLDGLLKNA